MQQIKQRRELKKHEKSGREEIEKNWEADCHLFKDLVIKLREQKETKELWEARTYREKREVIRKHRKAAVERGEAGTRGAAKNKHHLKRL